MYGCSCKYTTKFTQNSGQFIRIQLSKCWREDKKSRTTNSGAATTQLINHTNPFAKMPAFAEKLTPQLRGTHDCGIATFLKMEFLSRREIDPHIHFDFVDANGDIPQQTVNIARQWIANHVLQGTLPGLPQPTEPESKKGGMSKKTWSGRMNKRKFQLLQIVVESSYLSSLRS